MTKPVGAATVKRLAERYNVFCPLTPQKTRTTVREERPPRGRTVAAQALGNPRGLKPAARSWRGIVHGRLNVHGGTKCFIPSLPLTM